MEQAPLDELNDRLLMAQDKLRELDYGVSAEVALTGTTTLGFGKTSQGWCLYITPNDREARTPLRQATKAQRLAASAKLVGLHAQMYERWTLEHGDVKRAIDTIDEFLATVDFASAMDTEIMGDPTEVADGP